MVTLRRTWHVHFDTDAEELLAGVQVGMVAGPRCRTHSHAAECAIASVELATGCASPWSSSPSPTAGSAPSSSAMTSTTDRALSASTHVWVR